MYKIKNSLWRFVYFYELKCFQFGYVLQENAPSNVQVEYPDKLYPISYYGFLTLTQPFKHDNQNADILALVVHLVSKQQPSFYNARNYQFVQFAFVNKQFSPIFAIKEHFRIKRALKNERDHPTPIDPFQTAMNAAVLKSGLKEMKG